VDVVKGSHEHGNASAGDSEALRPGGEFSVAVRKAARGEREVKLAVSRRQVPDGGGEEATRREVVGWERHPGGRVGRIRDEAAFEFVERTSETAQVGFVAIGGEIDVEGVVAMAVRLDAGAADDDELHVVIDENLQERFALGVDGGSRDRSLLAQPFSNPVLRRPTVCGARGPALAFDVEHGLKRE